MVLIPSYEECVVVSDYKMLNLILQFTDHGNFLASETSLQVFRIDKKLLDELAPDRIKALEDQLFGCEVNMMKKFYSIPNTKVMVQCDNYTGILHLSECAASMGMPCKEVLQRYNFKLAGDHTKLELRRGYKDTGSSSLTQPHNYCTAKISQTRQPSTPHY